MTKAPNISRYLIAFTLLNLAACAGKSDKNVATETNVSGRIQMLVDESISPIVNEQLAVFKSDYPKAEINLKYCNESDLMNHLLNDSIKYKSAVISRDLTKDEINFLVSKKRTPQIRKFAIDGIALITNEESSIDQIDEKVLYSSLKSGRMAYPLVFDNGGSSTIFYLKNKAGIDKLPENGIFVLGGYQEVINYVQGHKNYVGVIGLNRLIKNDTTGYATPNKIKLLAVKDSTGKAYKPTPNNLMTGLYPLRRELFIVNLKFGYGLGIGFASWLCSDRGQLLTLKSGLAPITEPARELRVLNKNVNFK